MSATISWAYQRLPGWMLLAALSLKRLIRPSARYKQLVRLYDALNRPDQVQSGPFAGMKYVWYAAGSALLPKMIGSYEMELADVIEQICRDQPDLVIDVGSAEGYYAVGMARRLPQARVLAYDTARLARDLLQKLVILNGVVGRVTQRNFCAPADLARDLATAANPLLICDCEGFEGDLLRPDLVPALGKTTILVELHELLRPGVSADVRQRFIGSHELTEIPARARRAADLPARFKLSTNDAEAAMDEGRTFAQSWLVMKPNVK